MLNLIDLDPTHKMSCGDPVMLTVCLLPSRHAPSPSLSSPASMHWPTHPRRTHRVSQMPRLLAILEAEA